MVAEALLGGVAEAVVGFLLEKGTTSIKERLGLARDPITVAFDTALHRAVADTFVAHQEYDGALFHANFLKYEGAPLLAATLTLDDKVTGADLAAAWAHRPSVSDNRNALVRWMTPICNTFLASLRSHLRAHHALLAINQTHTNIFIWILSALFPRLREPQIIALKRLNLEMGNFQKQRLEAMSILNRTIYEQLTMPTVLRAINDKLSSGIPQLSPTYNTLIRNFIREYVGDGNTKIPFGGRDTAWQMLNGWLANPDAPACLLVTAEAGRGKSALLVRWSMFLEKYTDVEVVFVPISIRFETGAEEVFYAVLAARLAKIHGDTLKYQQMSAAQWRAIFHDYVSRPAPAHKRIVVVIDGADETTGRPLGAGFLPLPLPDNVRVVLSARVKAGEGATGWIRQLGWHLRGTARSETLEPLDPSGVREVLAFMGNPLDGLASKGQVVEELYRLTEGDPLLVRLYVDALVKQAVHLPSLTAGDLPKMQPGLQGYFTQWWEDQERLWEGRGENPAAKQKEVKDFLYAVATALGPLHKDDVIGVLGGDLDRSDVTSMAKAVERFVIGDGMRQGYSFSHPRLGYYFADQLSQKQKDAWNEKFVMHGHMFLTEIRDEHKLHWASDEIAAASYRIQHYATHLTRSKATPEQLYNLVCHELARAWEALRGTYDGFLGTLDLVAKRAERDLNYVRSMEQQVLCALCRSSIIALSSNISPELLVNATRFGILSTTQALALLQQYNRVDNQAKAIEMFVKYFVEDEGFLVRLLTVISTIEDEFKRENLLVAIAPHLPNAVLEITQSIENEYKRKTVLVALAPHLPNAVLEIAQSIENEYIRVDVLIALIPHVPNAVLKVAQRMRYQETYVKVLSASFPYMTQTNQQVILQEVLEVEQPLKFDYRVKILVASAPLYPELVLEAMRDVEDEAYRAKLLVILAPYRPDAVLTLVESIENEKLCLEVLVALIPHVSHTNQQAILQQALEAAMSLQQYDRKRVEILSTLAPYLPEAVLEAARRMDHETMDHIFGERTRLLIALIPYLPDAVLEGARRIKYKGRCVEVLIALAQHMPEANQKTILQEALEAAKSIEDEESRVEALVTLALYLPDAVLEATKRIEDEESRAHLLAMVAPFISQPKQQPVLQEALQISQHIRDEGRRAYLSAALAPHISLIKQQAVLQEALEAAKSIEHEESRVEVLITLAPYLPDAVLEATKSIEDEESRAHLLAALVPHISLIKQQAVLQEALEAAMSIEYEWRRVDILVTLASYLPDAVLEATKSIADKGRQVEVLVTLTPYLPDAVLEVAKSIEEGRAHLLAALVPHIPLIKQQAVLQEALEAAKSIEHEGRRVDMLVTLAPYLPDAVLEVAKRIEEEESRAHLLAALVPHISLIKQQAVLQDILVFRDPYVRDSTNLERRMKEEGYWGKVLVAIAPYHSNDVLEIVPSIHDWDLTIEVLVALAPHLPDAVFQAPLRVNDERPSETLVALSPYLPEAVLEVAHNIKDNKSRAEVLVALVPHLPRANQRAILQEALESARRISSHWDRTEMLLSLTSLLGEYGGYSDKNGLSLWHTTIAALSRYPRPEFLMDLTTLLPFTLAFAENATVTLSNSYITNTQLTQLRRYLHRPYVDLPTVAARRNLLADAGLSDLEPHLTLQGDQDTFVHALVRLVQDRNRTIDLIRHLQATLPGHEDLQAWAADILGTTPLTPRQQLAQGILDAVQEVCSWWP